MPRLSCFIGRVTREQDFAQGARRRDAGAAPPHARRDAAQIVIYAPREAWSRRVQELKHGEGAWELCYEWDVTGGKKTIKQTSRRHGGSRWNPDAPYLSDSSHDSDSGDEEGSVEGVDWEWMDLPFGFERVKFVFSRAEARHRRRAARRQAAADA